MSDKEKTTENDDGTKVGFEIEIGDSNNQNNSNDNDSQNVKDKDNSNIEKIKENELSWIEFVMYFLFFLFFFGSQSLRCELMSFAYTCVTHKQINRNTNKKNKHCFFFIIIVI